MKITTLRDILTSKEETAPGHRLYLVQTEETVLYVGQSKNPQHRLREHVGITGRGDESILGELIFYNLPASLSWQVQLLTSLDCLDYVKQVFSFYRNFDWYTQSSENKYAVDTAEIALLRHFKPCLNVVQNAAPSSLPKTIIDPFKISSSLPHPNPRFYLMQLLKEAQIRAMQENAL